MWFGIGKMCLEKNMIRISTCLIIIPRTVRCAHFTQSERDRKIESELRALIQM